MRRNFFVCSAILLVSLLGLIFVFGRNQLLSGKSQARDAAHVLSPDDIAAIREEAGTSATTTPKNTEDTVVSYGDGYPVVRVVDGDTLDVLINNNVERLRLIGMDTPETVDPRKPVQCFGIEASNKAEALLTGKEVALENDPTQGERDKYGRLLQYVFLPDGTNFNLLMIREGYAHEYTYGAPYRFQKEFKNAERDARQNGAGLWGAKCAGKTASVSSASAPQSGGGVAAGCTIKGNINAKQEKIYHVIGCGSYNKTVIDESAGEKWFCSEEDALNAGWRKAKDC